MTQRKVARGTARYCYYYYYYYFYYYNTVLASVQPPTWYERVLGGERIQDVLGEGTTAGSVHRKHRPEAPYDSDNGIQPKICRFGFHMKLEYVDVVTGVLRFQLGDLQIIPVDKPYSLVSRYHQLRGGEHIRAPSPQQHQRSCKSTENNENQ
uniref:Uncharacterized protein n=1 Tax=Anopheles atroparvus TaxID=41427 RepID=A0A182JFN7_ANOAO